jgi:hypothetical protein
VPRGLDQPAQGVLAEGGIVEKGSCCLGDGGGGDADELTGVEKFVPSLDQGCSGATFRAREQQRATEEGNEENVGIERAAQGEAEQRAQRLGGAENEREQGKAETGEPRGENAMAARGAQKRNPRSVAYWWLTNRYTATLESFRCR